MPHQDHRDAPTGEWEKAMDQAAELLASLERLETVGRQQRRWVSPWQTVPEEDRDA